MLDEHEALLAALDRGEERVVLVVESGAIARTGLAIPVRQRLHALVPDEDWVLEPAHLPLVAVRLRDRETLEAIEADPGVAHTEPDRDHTASALPSLELIGQPAALSRGADGRDLSVAVIDTGADYTRAAFGACSAPGPTCAIAYAQDFATSDGVADDPASMHGTNVAGIVRLVAPSARVLALDVFTGRTASSVHTAAAIDWVIANRDAYHIVAVNMSLGHGGFTAPCPSDALSVAAQRLRDAGIVPVIASGNDGFTNAISSPGCAPAAVSVGATNSSGVVASFSNSASFLTILAPGVSIDAAGIVMSGTSQATPHVAGAIAALRTAYPDDSVSDAVARLVGTGVTTVDARNGLTFRRLSLDAATAGGATAPPPDIAPPTGTFAFGSTFVRTTGAAWTLSATDASVVTSMCISAAASCTAFVPFATSGTFTLPSGDGLKTVRVWLRDAVGNTTATPLSATVTLDARAPTAGTATATAGIERVSLAITGATDAGSGIAGYRVVFSTTATAPASCAVGSVLADGTATSWAHEGLVAGTTYRYRICAIDRAGNVAAGALVSAMAVAELDPPTGTIVLDGGATWARSTRVIATLTASDASTVTHVCLSATATCTSWVAFAPTVATSLGTGTGERPIYARFRDRWGNVSAAAVSDGILLDVAMPANPTVSASRGDAALTFAWAEGSDTPSGLAGYRFAIGAGTTAPACTTGVSVAAAIGGTRQHVASGLTNGTTYAWRVCAVDVAGNVSTGTTGTAMPTPEMVAPTPGSIVVAGGAAWARTSTVIVEASATDASGVASMCLSTSATCTRWVPYAASSSFALGTVAGARTVYAWFRDPYGNATSTPVTDTIGFDGTAPTNPVVTAVARSGGVDLSFTAATDATSGVAGYRLAWGSGSSAPPCTAGVDIDAASPRTASITSTTLVRYRLCALDVAGNVSAGTVGAATPLP